MQEVTLTVKKMRELLRALRDNNWSVVWVARDNRFLRSMCGNPGNVNSTEFKDSC